MLSVVCSPPIQISTAYNLHFFFQFKRFKNKYHPDESTKRKEEQFNNLKVRHIKILSGVASSFPLNRRIQMFFFLAETRQRLHGILG